MFFSLKVLPRLRDNVNKPTDCRNENQLAYTPLVVHEKNSHTRNYMEVSEREKNKEREREGKYVCM